MWALMRRDILVSLSLENTTCHIRDTVVHQRFLCHSNVLVLFLCCFRETLPTLVFLEGDLSWHISTESQCRRPSSHLVWGHSAWCWECLQHIYNTWSFLSLFNVMARGFLQHSLLGRCWSCCLTAVFTWAGTLWAETTDADQSPQFPCMLAGPCDCVWKMTSPQVTLSPPSPVVTVLPPSAWDLVTEGSVPCANTHHMCNIRLADIWTSQDQLLLLHCLTFPN